MDERWFPVVARADVPAIDTAAMVEVDRLMVGEFAIGIVRMMELAGRNLAHLARVRFLGGAPANRHAVVLAGGGGNGGGALVCARRLAGWGARVRVFLAEAPDGMRGIAGEQRALLAKIGVPGADDQGRPDALAEARETADVIIDGLIGYGLKAAPQGLAGSFIEIVAASASKMLALDVPSGLDATTGEAHGPAVRAEATMTLALPKTGLTAAAARAHVGDLYLADIGVPPALYALPRLGLNVPPLFARSDILRLDY